MAVNDTVQNDPAPPSSVQAGLLDPAQPVHHAVPGLVRRRGGWSHVPVLAKPDDVARADDVEVRGLVFLQLVDA